MFEVEQKMLLEKYNKKMELKEQKIERKKRLLNDKTQDAKVH